MKKTLLRIGFLSGFIGVFFVAHTNQNSPGGGYTNAPSESNCSQSSCHTGSSLVTSGTNWNRIKLSDNFTGGGYIPDTTYELVLTYKETGMSRSGFQITCLDATNSPAGSFGTLDSRTRLMSASIGGKTRSYLGQSSSGASTISTDTSSYRIEWTAPSKNLGALTFYVCWNKANGNNNQSGDLIYAKTFSVGPSSLLPTAKVKIQDANYCTNSALTFDADLSGSPTSYAWSFPSGSPTSSTQQNPKVTYFSTGTYKAILTVKNSKGTSTPDTLTFTVKQGASFPIITPGGTREICKGDSLQLTASQLAGHTYSWSPNGETDRTIMVADSGQYFVTVTNANSCSRKSSVVTLKVNESPTIMAIKSFSGDTICTGSEFTIAGLVMSGTVDSFSFVSASGPFIDTNKISDMLNSGSKTYKVYGKSGKGCVSPASTITVHSKTRPAGPALTSDNIDYTGFRVNWAAVTGATGYRVSVDSGKTFINPSSGATGLSHTVTGLLGNHSMNVRVYATLSGKCTESEVSNITVTTLSCTPIDYAIETGVTRVCRNSEATVVLHGLKGMKFGVQIDGANAPADTTVKITVTDTRNYVISVIDSNALICGYTHKNVLLTEDTVATPVLTPAGTLAICNNEVQYLQNFAVNSHSTFDSVFFFRNNSIVASGKSLSAQISVSHQDSIYTQSKNAGGCISETSDFARIQFKPIPSALFSVSNSNFDYSFTANDTTGDHKWKLDNDSTTGYTADFDLSAFANDTAFIEHSITLNGCTATETLKLFVPDFAGTRTKSIQGLRIFPNPASESFTVTIPELKGQATLDLFNTAGELVLSARINNQNTSIDTRMLAEGLYLYNLNSGRNQNRGSLIISH